MSEKNQDFKDGYLQALQWVCTLWDSPLFNHEDIQRCIRRGIKMNEEKMKGKK